MCLDTLLAALLLNTISQYIIGQVQGNFQGTYSPKRMRRELQLCVCVFACVHAYAYTVVLCCQDVSSFGSLQSRCFILRLGESLLYLCVCVCVCALSHCDSLLSRCFIFRQPPV